MFRQGRLRRPPTLQPGTADRHLFAASRGCTCYPEESARVTSGRLQIWHGRLLIKQPHPLTHYFLRSHTPSLDFSAGGVVKQPPPISLPYIAITPSLYKERGIGYYKKGFIRGGDKRQRLNSKFRGIKFGHKGEKL